MYNETKINVRFNECGINGYAHHSSYNCWLEMAQLDLFKKHDTDFVQILDKGYYFPIIKLAIDFISPIRLGDDVLVRLRIKDLGRIKIVFDYEILNEKDNTLIAKASSEHVFLSKGSKPADIKRGFPDLYKALGQYVI